MSYNALIDSLLEIKGSAENTKYFFQPFSIQPLGGCGQADEKIRFKILQAPTDYRSNRMMGFIDNKIGKGLRVQATRCTPEQLVCTDNNLIRKISTNGDWLTRKQCFHPIQPVHTHSMRWANDEHSGLRVLCKIENQILLDYPGFTGGCR